jgi:hypothetical protein
MAATSASSSMYKSITGKFTTVGRCYLRSYLLHTRYPNDTQWKELEEKTGCKKSRLQVSEIGF